MGTVLLRGLCGIVLVGILAGCGHAALKAWQQPFSPTELPPTAVAQAQRRMALDYCRANVFFPKQIVIPYSMEGTTQILVELSSQGLMVIGTVADVREQANKIRAGEQKGFHLPKGTP